MNNWKLNNGSNYLHCVKFGDEAGLMSVFFKKLYSMFGFDYVQRAEKVRRPCNY